MLLGSSEILLSLRSMRVREVYSCASMGNAMRPMLARCRLLDDMQLYSLCVCMYVCMYVYGNAMRPILARCRLLDDMQLYSLCVCVCMYICMHILQMNACTLPS